MCSTPPLGSGNPRPAVAVHLQYVHVMGEPVLQGSSDTFRSGYLGPPIEGQVGGDQDGTPLVALAEHQIRPGGTDSVAGCAAVFRPQPPAVRFTSFSPARRPSAVTQPVYFANMALLDRRACRMVAESVGLAGPALASGPGWKQPCLRPRLEIPPCRSSGGGWKTRFISPWQDGILLPIPARGAAGCLAWSPSHS